MCGGGIKGDDLHRIFKSLDKNNVGQVSVHELHHLLESIGVHSTLEEMGNFVGDENLGYVDFLFFYEAAVLKYRRSSTDQKDDYDEDLFQAFGVFDLNGDGLISSDELQSVLSRLGLWDKSCGRDCKEMIRFYDRNSDGVLDFDEFKNMMMTSSV